MRLKIGLVLIVTAAFLVAVLWGYDLDVGLEAARQTGWWFLLPMGLLYLFSHCVRSYRLGLLLGTPVPFMRLLSVTSIGFLAINVVPLRLGEFVRPYLLNEQEGVPFGRALAAVFMERLLDMGALLFLLLGLTWLVELPPGGVVVSGVDVVAAGQRAAGGLLTVGALGGAVLVLVGEPAIRLIERLPVGGMVGGLARRFREGLLDLVKAPARALLLVVLTATIWGTTLVAVNVVLHAFPGVPTGIGPAWATWTITLSGMVAVPTPGFFGPYEVFCSAALWLFGVEASLARTFALTLHVGQFLFTLSVGVTFLVREGLGLRTLVAGRGELGAAE